MQNKMTKKSKVEVEIEGFGTRIQKARKEKGWSQKELGETLDITRETIAKWEKEYNQPSAKWIKRLAEVLEVDITELMYGESSAYITEPEELWETTRQKCLDVKKIDEIVNKNPIGA